MNVGDFIHKSTALAGVKSDYIRPKDFLNAYSTLDDIERKSLVLHYIMDNSPFAFEKVYEKPLLFEQVRQYISYILEVDVSHVKLIGSTKTGFKMDSDNYGVPYSKASDLDFMIIDKGLFVKLVYEFDVWKKAYQVDGSMHPKNDTEKGYWDESMVKLPRNIAMGYLDTYKIPNRPDRLPVNSRVNNTMSNVVRNLKIHHGFSTKKASMRVYKDVDCFFCQQNRNIEHIMAAIGK